jgi:hypothetical protein
MMADELSVEKLVRIAANALASTPQAWSDEIVSYKLDRREIDDMASNTVAALQRPIEAAQRASIAAFIEHEGEKRGRHMARAGRILADAIRAGFDLSDEPAPAGARAKYNDAPASSAGEG